MKLNSLLLILSLSCLPVALHGEGKGNTDWAEKAARGYEEKAKWAEQKGDPASAAIYRRMAAIKREAGAASKKGKKFSWDEYHELEGKLHKIQKGHAKHKKQEQPGEGFLRAAKNYRKMASKAREAGDADKAMIYTKLAGMKVAAANAAKQGKGYDWTEYKELKKQLHGGDKHKDWNKKKDFKPGKLNIE